MGRKRGQGLPEWFPYAAGHRQVGPQQTREEQGQDGSQGNGDVSQQIIRFQARESQEDVEMFSVFPGGISVQAERNGFPFDGIGQQGVPENRGGEAIRGNRIDPDAGPDG